jgi:flagellar biosynthetic protein FlhB
MADEREDGQERTEQPTARRLQQAREEGRVARSAEVSSAAVLLAGAAVLAAAGGGAIGSFAQHSLRLGTSAMSMGEMTTAGAVQIVRTLVLGLLLALLPFALGVMGASLAAGLAQTRGMVSWGPVKPKLSHLNPLQGIKRIFSADAVMNLVKALLKLIVLAWVSWAVIARSWPELLVLPDVDVLGTAEVARALALRLAFVTGLAFLVLALADFAWQWWRHQKSMRMTRQEVALEYRETEGDPTMKGRIRQMQRQRARERMMHAVPTADVVVTNPTHVAVALRYDVDESPAPLVVAMGERKLAERIKAIAKDAGVPCVENVPVARALLAAGTVGKPIPPALYAAVAEILAWVYRQRAAGLLRPRRDAGRAAA